MEIKTNLASSSGRIGNHNFIKEQNKTVRSSEPKEEVTLAPKKARNSLFLLDAILTFSLAAIFFGLPIFFMGVTMQGIAFDKQMYFFFFILVSLVCWVVKGAALGRIQIRRTPLDIPILIFVFLYFLATVFSFDKWHSFWGFFGDPSRGFLNILALAAGYYLIVSNFNRKRLNLSIGALIFSGSLVSIWTLLVLLNVGFLPDVATQTVPFSLMGAISSTGTFLGIMVLLMITAVFKLSKKEEGGWVSKAVSFLILAVIAVNMIVLMMLYSYMNWIGFLAGMSVFVIYVLARIISPDNGWLWLPMAVFVGTMAILMIGSNEFAKVSLPVEVSPSYALSWEVAKGALSDKPVLGSGTGTYGYNFSLYKPLDFNNNKLSDLRFAQGTGIFFESLPTIGVVGTLALALLLVSFISVGTYLLSINKEKNKIYSLGLMSSSIVFLVSASIARLEGPILILGGLLVSVAIFSLMEESDTEKTFFELDLKASPKYALSLAFVLMVVSTGVAALFVFIGKAVVADVYAGMALREEVISEQGSIAKLSKAIKLSGREGRYFTRIGQEYGSLVNVETGKSEAELDKKRISDYLAFSVKYADMGSRKNPNDIGSLESLAQLYENSSVFVPEALSLAQENYEKASSLDPNNPVYDLKLGQIRSVFALRAKEDAEKKTIMSEAKELFAKSVEKKKDYHLGYFYLSLADEALDMKDEAVSNMEKAVSLLTSREYLLNLGRLYAVRGSVEDLERGQKILEALISQNENDADAHLNLGILYAKQGKKQQARDEYEQVISLLPSEATEQREQISKWIDDLVSGNQNSPNDSVYQETVSPLSVEQQSGPLDIDNPVTLPEDIKSNLAPSEGISGEENGN